MSLSELAIRHHVLNSLAWTTYPPVGMMDDAERITDELVQVIDIEHKDVAIVAHSYGGIVAS
ncbi:hypothetical protein N7481_010995 [Penicillium waksmanii]|uniref:uncharacterized protein n=1 Tax=Penicillium waksmanii TaxID=69791 RepID=UPI002546618E|nr:uncharacterized protein N7481_010995 [Penicillium waksmanii]KAJ5973785.1 hypothetical protein N7481_010995 [Penicillium waksmanii]